MKLVVIKRVEALIQRIPVTYLGFEYRSVHGGDRRGFTVKLQLSTWMNGWTLFNCSTQRQR